MRQWVGGEESQHGTNRWESMLSTSKDIDQVQGRGSWRVNGRACGVGRERGFSFARLLSGRAAPLLWRVSALYFLTMDSALYHGLVACCRLRGVDFAVLWTHSTLVFALVLCNVGIPDGARSRSVQHMVF